MNIQREREIQKARDICTQCIELREDKGLALDMLYIHERERKIQKERKRKFRKESEIDTERERATVPLVQREGVAEGLALHS